MGRRPFLDGRPVGFTLEVDGDPHCVDRVAEAVMRAYNDMRVEVEEPVEMMAGGPVPVRVGFPPLQPDLRMVIQYYAEHRELKA